VIHPSRTGDPLRVAVDARDLLRDERGIGRYLRAVLARLASDPEIALTLLVHDVLPRRLHAAFARALGTADVRLGRRAPRDAQVIWHPWNGTFFAGTAPAVATLHDVAPFAFPAADAHVREAQQAPFRRTAAIARAVLCDSAFTAGEAERRLGIASARTRVVPLGVDPAFSPGPPGGLPPELRDRPYVLHVGAHDAHKNVATLARAHAAAFPDGACALVCTRRGAEAPQALVYDRVSHETLLALYRGATLVAVPSLYEGFGLPVLEAMACGAPVLAARAASLPEVGGDAVRYVEEPRDVADWTAALRALVADGPARRDLAARGAARAAIFTWERCAEATLAVLREVAAV